MNYSEALEAFKKAKSAMLQAEKALVLDRMSLNKQREQTPDLHDKLTTVMANHQAGEASKEDVESARHDYEQSLGELEELKTNAAAREKAVPIFRDKMVVAKKAYIEASYPHYHEKAHEVIQQYGQAFAKLIESYGVK